MSSFGFFPRELRKKTSLQTFTMQFLPQDPNHIYVGTDAVSGLYYTIKVVKLLLLQLLLL